MLLERAYKHENGSVQTFVLFSGSGILLGPKTAISLGNFMPSFILCYSLPEIDLDLCSQHDFSIGLWMILLMSDFGVKPTAAFPVEHHCFLMNPRTVFQD